MKKVRVVTALLLALISVFALFGCGDGDGSGKTANKSDVEKLKTNLENTYNGLDNVPHDKFFMSYEVDNAGIVKQEVGYDANGSFYCKEYKSETKETLMLHVWVEEDVVKTAYYYKENNNYNPDKRWWQKDCYSHEQAMEEFHDYFPTASIASTFFYPNKPDVYARIVSSEFIDLLAEEVAWSIESEYDRWTYNIEKNTSNHVKFNLKYVYGYVNDTFSMEIKDGRLISYTEDSHLKVNYSLSLDWTFEKPNLDTYFEY